MLAEQHRTEGEQGLYRPQYEHDACGMGFVVHTKGEQSHEIIQQALQVLENMEHRGATGAEPNSGDGAGILIQIPHNFLVQEFKQLGVEVPPRGDRPCCRAPRRRCRSASSPVQ